MTVMPSAKKDATDKYSTPLLLTLIVSGLAGNYFNFTIFHNVYFFFGSIFSLLALQFLGLGRGILAAAIIAGYTWILRGHPYAFIIMTAEVAIVGLLMGRRKIGMVLADTLYWLFIGMPMVYLFFHVIMNVSISSTYVIMTKHAVNGIANALVARLIFTGIVLRTRSSLISYSEIVYNLLTFFVLCPALIMLVVESRIDFNETDRNIRSALLQDRQRVAQRMETWLSNRKAAILILADMSASRSTHHMQLALEQAKKSDVNFLRIGLIDREATSIAFFPLTDEFGQRAIGKSFADRPFIPMLKKNLEPMLSEVVLCKLGTPKPRVLMLAPVVIHGEYNGYVSGMLSLEQIREHLDSSKEQNATLYTLLDKYNNVIMTNRKDQKVMMPFVRGKGRLSRLGNGISHWSPQLPPNTPPPESWMKSFYVAETAIGDLAEWQLVLELQVAPFHNNFYDHYTGKLTLLFLVLLVGLVLAGFLSRRLIVTLKKLSLITLDLPVRLATKDKDIAWPESGILEINQLSHNFRVMGDALTVEFNEVRQINESLEKQTAVLQESEAKYRLLFDNANDAIFIVDSQARVLAVNSMALEQLGYTHAELMSMTINQVVSTAERVHVPERMARLMEQGHLTFETVHQRKDGSLIPTEVSARLIKWDGQTAIMSIRRDITERKQIHQSRLAAMGEMVSAIAHQWRQPLATLGMIIQRAHAVGTIQQGLTPSYLEEFKVNSMRQIRHMSETIEEFRDFYRLEKQKKPFYPFSCINDAAKLIESQLSSSGIVVDVHCIGCDGQLVNGFANEFKQVILNLLGNARDAILERRKIRGEPEKGLIDVQMTVSGDSSMIIDISDNGCGIPAEIAPRIFAHYFTTKEKSGGTGIGLYMSRMIVEDSLEGHLRLVQGHEGATFRIELPLEKSP